MCVYNGQMMPCRTQEEKAPAGCSNQWDGKPTNGCGGARPECRTSASSSESAQPPLWFHAPPSKTAWLHVIKSPKADQDGMER